MSDEDYAYFARRLVVEQDCARIATCREAATAHQRLANAYLGRLQSLILSPYIPVSEATPTLTRTSVDVTSAENSFNTYLDLRIAETRGSNPV